MSDWLDCKLIESSWRPTRLLEGVYSDGIIYYNDNSKIKVSESGKDATSMTLDLIRNSINDNGQNLIFVETRKILISLAKTSSEIIYKTLSLEEKKSALKYSKLLLDNNDDTDLTNTLSNLISLGVGFHHAGLSLSSREIVEKAFKNGIIKALFATPTLDCRQKSSCSTSYYYKCFSI